MTHTISEPRHICESRQFDRALLETIFGKADTFDHGMGRQTLRGKNIVALFYQPSTRTSSSFYLAATQLGANCLVIHDAAHFSSAVKGESLRDTGTVYACMGYDAIIMRHPQATAVDDMKLYTTIPVINAGCGGNQGQHVSQALLDLYTIQKRRGEIDGTHIAFVGDLARGRTVRSLAYLLARSYEGVHLTFISPKEMALERDIVEYLARKGVSFKESASLEDALTADVVYTTRLQFEWLGEREAAEMRARQYSFAINKVFAQRMRKDAIIMHPLPRNEELDGSVDHDPRAAYFDQVKYGVWVRKALLEYVFRIIG